jgi:AraC family transcriptional regulator
LTVSQAHRPTQQVSPATEVARYNFGTSGLPGTVLLLRDLPPQAVYRKVPTNILGITLSRGGLADLDLGGKRGQFELEPFGMSFIQAGDVGGSLWRTSVKHIAIACEDQSLWRIAAESLDGHARAFVPASVLHATPCELGRLGLRLANELCGQGLGTRLAIESIASEMLRRLVTNHLVVDRSAIPGSIERASQKIRLALECIHDRQGEDLRLAEIADVAGLGISQISMLFKRHVGLPPHQYAMWLRVQRARERLLRTRDPITNIAHDLGFSDHAHFSRVFLRFMGQTPSGFRDRA